MRMVYRFLPRFFSIVNMRILHLLSNEFFRSRKDEVIKVTHLDFTWERREELIRKEEREDGKSPTKNAFVGDFLLSKQNITSANL